MGSIGMDTVMASLLGGVAAALVTAIFTKAASDKSIRIRNITSERQLWRDRLRELVVYSGCAPELHVLRAELEVRLNPGNPEDNGILDCLRCLAYRHDSAKLDEFSRRMAMLLKHDYERARIESSARSAAGIWALREALATPICVVSLVYRDHPDLMAELPTRTIVLGMVWGGLVALLVLPVSRLLSYLVNDLMDALLMKANKEKKPCVPVHKLRKHCAALRDRAFWVPYSPGAQTESDVS